MLSVDFQDVSWAISACGLGILQVLSSVITAYYDLNMILVRVIWCWISFITLLRISNWDRPVYGVSVMWLQMDKLCEGNNLFNKYSLPYFSKLPLEDQQFIFYMYK